MKSLAAYDPDRGQWTSASNAPADTLCLARHEAQKDFPALPEEEKDDATQSGERIHRALYTRDTSSLSLEEFKDYETISTVEADLVDLVFNPINARKASVYRERRLWMVEGEKKRHSGQPDVVYLHNDRALIIEYKCGWNEVPSSPHNLQLRDQAVLLSVNTMGQVDLITTAVLQRPFRMPEICGYTKNDLIKAFAQVSNRIAASQDPGNIGLRTPGRVQCAYCRAKPGCQPYHRWSSEGLPLTRTLVDKPLAQWTSEDMVTFEKNYRNAQNWLELCHNHIKSVVAKAPNEFPEFSIRPGAKEHPVLTEKIEELHQRFLDLGGSTAEFMRCLSLVKGTFEKEVARVSDTKGKQLDNILEALLKGLTYEKQKQGSLVLKKDV